jgi:hypothetical protein
MSTNYYDANPPRYADALDPQYHVAKRVSLNKKPTLLWAMTPERFGQITGIVDEYGREYGWQEWVDEVLQHSDQSFESVGEWFS